jgi:predicted house-cleaning noncanonical NTP pyrophosphatase (MazG superfamily)
VLLDSSQRVNIDLNSEIDNLSKQLKREELAQLLSVISQVRELLTTNAAQLMLVERVFLTFASLNRGNWHPN